MLKIIVILNVLIFILPLVACGESESHYTYREQKGKIVSQYSQTIIDFGNRLICVIKQGENRQQVVCSRQEGTLSWDMRVKNGELTAERLGDNIVLKGIRDGNKISIRYDVGKTLWHQILSVSLKPFVLSREKSELFYLIRPATLKFYKCKAVKEERVSLILNGVERDCVKVRIRLDGWRSFAWYVDYYFELETGLFVKYEARKILPGTDSVVVTLIPPVKP